MRRARLEEAERLKARDDLARLITPTERDYLAQCRQKEDAERSAERVRLAREQAQIARTRKFQKRTSWALTVIFIVVIAALAGALWQSYQTSKQAAAVFASTSATAFAQDFCDRALRMVVAGLPPSQGASPLIFSSSELEGDLSLYASAKNCPFKLAFSGHTDGVLTAAFSPDGSRVVTASKDRTARLWDAKTGAALATLSGHTGALISAAFSPDGSRIVTASGDNTARLWDAKTGAALATLSGHTDGVRIAAFSPDGRRVVTASSDKTARLWDAQTGTVLATLSAHTNSLLGAVISAVFNPDGSRIVTASWDPRRATVGCQERQTPRDAHATYRYRERSFSPDGRRVVTASADNTARLWDAAPAHTSRRSWGIPTDSGAQSSARTAAAL